MAEEDIETKIRKMAEEHADYTIGLLSQGLATARYLYIEAFIHGVKHGEELRRDG